MRILLLLAAFVALVKGQVEPHCCVPDDEWEMNEGFMIGSSTKGIVSQIVGNAFVSFSATKQMENSNITESAGGKKIDLRVLKDYQKMMQYTIDATGKCTKSPLTQGFKKACLPGDAKLLYSSYMGTETQNLPIDIYEMEASGFKISVTVSPLKDKKFCAPIGETLIGHVSSSYEIVEEGFMNYHKGIKDPAVFVVPAQCNSAPLLQLPVNPARRYQRSVFL